MANNHTQLLVIGAGPGGYAAAFYAADSGLEVTVVDTEPYPGGVCLYRGCIPSKALLHVAKIISESKEAKNFGIEFETPKIHLDKLQQWKKSVITKLTGGLGGLCKQRKIHFIQGRAAFLNSHTVNILKIDGNEEPLSFEYCILATGSKPIRLPNIPDSDYILDSTSALEIADIPETLLIVGGGYIGLEIGTIYAQLGSKVTVAEMMPGPLPGVDRDLIAILEKRLEKLFVKMLFNTKVIEMKETPENIETILENKEGQKITEKYSKVLIAVGRKPNTTNLGLENTRIELNDKGFVKTDPQRRTTDSKIFAIGDIAGEPMLAHKASHEGRVAVEAILGKKTIFEPKAIPAVVFTDPEIAWGGLTENQALQEKRPVKIVKFPWGASGRAITLDRPDGMTKLMIDPQTERILGIAIVGTGAGELIAEGILAIEMGAVASDLSLSIHPHPTLTETLMESAEIFFGHGTHVYRPSERRL